MEIKFEKTSAVAAELTIEMEKADYQERVEKALIAMGRGEIRSLIAEGKPVTLNCHFCNTDYTFSQEELIGILQKLQAPK